MRTKTVKRYWCDHCNKAGLRAYAMAKHERHCTMNPERTCRTCTLINGGNGPTPGELRALVALLPTPVPQDWDDHGNSSPRFHQFMREVAEVAPKLREATDNCPACMLAAIRQAGVYVSLVEGFDFKKEMAEVLAAKAREDDDNRGFTTGWC